MPSFLQEVVTESGQLTYASEDLLRARNFTSRAFADGKRRFVMPIEEIEAAFWQSPAGLKMKDQLSMPYDRSKCHPSALKTGRYALTAWESLKVVTRRQMTLVIKDIGLVRGRMIQTCCIGLIVGSLFYQLAYVQSNIRIFLGACFLLIMFTSMGGMSQMQAQIATKQSWFKMRDNLFYPSWCHAVAVTVVALPHQASDGLLVVACCAPHACSQGSSHPADPPAVDLLTGP